MSSPQTEKLPQSALRKRRFNACKTPRRALTVKEDGGVPTLLRRFGVGSFPHVWRGNLFLRARPSPYPRDIPVDRMPVAAPCVALPGTFPTQFFPSALFNRKVPLDALKRNSFPFFFLYRSPRLSLLLSPNDSIAPFFQGDLRTRIPLAPSKIPSFAPFEGIVDFYPYGFPLEGSSLLPICGRRFFFSGAPYRFFFSGFHKCLLFTASTSPPSSTTQSVFLPSDAVASRRPMRSTRES